MIDKESIELVTRYIKAITLSGKIYVWIGLKCELLASRNRTKIADATRIVGCYTREVTLSQLTADVRETERQFLATPAGKRAQRRRAA